MFSLEVKQRSIN